MSERVSPYWTDLIMSERVGPSWTDLIISELVPFRQTLSCQRELVPFRQTSQCQKELAPFWTDLIMSERVSPFETDLIICHNELVPFRQTNLHLSKRWQTISTFCNHNASHLQKSNDKHFKVLDFFSRWSVLLKRTQAADAQANGVLVCMRPSYGGRG